MNNDIASPNEYQNALSQAKKLIAHAQEGFLRSANRISMEVRLNLGKIINENSIKPETNRPIGVSELKLFKTLPKNLIGKLPDPQELKRELFHSFDDMEKEDK